MGFFSQLLGSHDSVGHNGTAMKSMRRAATLPPSVTAHPMQDALLESEWIVPTTYAVGDAKHAGWQTAETVPAAPILMARHDDGQMAMLVFTDEEALKAWCAKGCAWAAVRGPDVFALAMASRVDRVVINPASPASSTLGREEIAALAGGFAAVQLNDDRSMADSTFGQALIIRSTEDEVDSRLLGHFQSALADHPEIASGYYFEMATGGEKPHLGIGVEFSCPVSPAAVHETLHEILGQMRPFTPEGTCFDLLPLTEDHLVSLAREHGRQFYREL